MSPGPGRLLRLVLAGGLAALSLLPVATWIPGGYDAHALDEVLPEWWSGGLIVLGLGAVLTLLSRRVPALWREGAWRRRVAVLALTAPRRLPFVAAGAAALYAVVARVVLSGRPLLLDELVQVWQGRLLLRGALWIPSYGTPELDGVQNIVDHGGKIFAQFPVGGPAMLALGSLVGAEWLVGPVFAGLAVWSWGVILRRTGEPEPSASNALLLFAFAPFAVFLSASHMNHVTSLAWILAGSAGLAVVTTEETPRPGVALLLGLAFGLAGTIRPVDALAFGGPAGGWLAWRALRDRRRISECALAALGMAIPLAGLLAANAATTGDPLRFGYELLWGPEHGLGFHAAPWGLPHTPARGLELINQYLIHLQIRFLETPFPALIPALAVLLFGARLRAFDRYLLAGSGAILVLYWAYWHNGFYLGPRFIFPLLPAAALFTGRFGTLLRERFGGDALPLRGWVYSASVGALLAVAINIPLRAKQYANAFVSWRWPAWEAAAEAGARDALVLVRESWGAHLIERMWGVGIPRPAAEFIYYRSDMCAMETTLGRLERDGVRGAAALAALTPLTADSLRLVDSVLSVDRTERYLPGSEYPPTCLARLREDRAGFTVYPPLLFDDRSGNVYIHDQQARDTLAIMRYPDRPLFLLAPDDTSLGSPIRFRPLRRDSLYAAWGLPPDWRPAATAAARSE